MFSSDKLTFYHLYLDDTFRGTAQDFPSARREFASQLEELEKNHSKGILRLLSPEGETLFERDLGSSSSPEERKGASPKIVNLTPHKVTVLTEDFHFLDYPPEGLARISTTHQKAFTLPNGIPVWKTTYGPPEGLPPMRKEVLYIVSLIVKESLPHRKDLLSPGTLIRDSEGKPLYCRGLVL